MEHPVTAASEIPVPLPPLGESAAAVYNHIVAETAAYITGAGFTDAVVGLSGGIDSALVATIAVDALGADHVHGVLMPSHVSSEHSIDDAVQLAASLGIDTSMLPIAPVYDAFIQTLDAEFAVAEPGVAEENLQARIRGTLLMTLSNRYGWFVLATGNKSEAFAGYATLHGDMVGGFAPLAPLYKGWVYELARYRNGCAGNPTEVAYGDREPSATVSGDVPIPQHCLVKEPSAELSPGQLDRHSLPEYPLLDAILHQLLDRGVDGDAVAALGFAAKDVERVQQLVAGSAFKRAMAAPGPELGV